MENENEAEIPAGQDIAEAQAQKAAEEDGANPKIPETAEEKEDDTEKEVIANEYPDYIKNGVLALPDDVKALCENGMDALGACRLTELKKTKALCAELSARLDAEKANRAGKAASIGSLSGGEAPHKDFYTSQEWDRLPHKEKEKFIKSGKIYEFMKRWSGK